MINLRYHIVSITAVFLALAIGVVMGTSFLGRATVDQLKSQIGRTETRISNTQKQNARLSGEIRRSDDRGAALREQGQQLLAGRLPDVPVLVIAAAGVDRDSLASLQSALEASDADFKGTLVVTEKLRLDGDDSAEMAELLGMATTERSEVRRVLTARFARMLFEAAEPESSTDDGSPGSRTTTTTRPRRTTSTTRTRPTSGTTSSTTTTTRPAPVEQDEPVLLTDLREGGWVSYEAPTGGSGDDPLLTTSGYRYVVVSGSEPSVPDPAFLGPVLRNMAETGPAPVVVASAASGDDPEGTRNAVVGPIRDDPTLKENLSTVDDLESFDGQAAVVLALEDLNAIHGHYGVGDGATSLLPPPR